MLIKTHEDTNKWIAFLFACLIALSPRIARWFHPEVWMEDSAYIYHAFTLMSGQQPFIDSIYAHPPGLERFLAFIYSIFGVSYRTAEILSSFVMIITTLCIYQLNRKETNKWIALAAAAAFSFSPLLFRYHVFEREVFTVMFASISFLIVQTKNSLKILLAVFTIEHIVFF